MARTAGIPKETFARSRKVFKGIHIPLKIGCLILLSVIVQKTNGIAVSLKTPDLLGNLWLFNNHGSQFFRWMESTIGIDLQPGADCLWTGWKCVFYFLPHQMRGYKSSHLSTHSSNEIQQPIVPITALNHSKRPPEAIIIIGHVPKSR